MQYPHAIVRRATDRRWPELAVRMVRLHWPGNKFPSHASQQSHKSCDADAALAGVLERWHSLQIPIPRLPPPMPMPPLA